MTGDVTRSVTGSVTGSECDWGRDQECDRE